MEVAAQKSSFIYRPVGIALAILGIAILWMLFPGNPTTLALLAIGIIFLFGLKRPVWALAAFLVSQLTITAYMVDTPFTIISLRLLLLMLIGIIIWRSRARNQIKLGEKAKRVLTPIFILIGISTVSNLVNSGFDYAFKDFRNMLVGLLIVIFLPSVIRNVKHLKILCGVAFILITASVIVAIMQHYQFLGLGQSTIIPGYLQQVGDNLRVPGMTGTSIVLSYILSTAVLAVLGIFLARGINRGYRRLLVISAVVMGLALYFTYTRSALFALLLGLVALFLFSRTRGKGEIILLVLLVATAYISLGGTMDSFSFSGRNKIGQEASTMERKILWQAGVAIAMDHPVLGIGGDQYKTVSPQYAGSVDPSFLKWEEDRYWSYRTLGNEAIHNDYLNMWVSYGTLALVAFLWITVTVLRNFLDSYWTSKQRFIKGLSIGLAAGLMAYMINSFYHNCLTVFSLFWILAGFSVATTQLAVKEKHGMQIPQVETGNHDS